MEVGTCRLVTISTDSLLESNEFRSGIGAHWPFLSDPARKLQKDLDIAEYTDPHHDPMIPHTLVRAAWAKGDKALFYPYGKSLAQLFSEQD